MATPAQESEALGGRVVGIETVNIMTDLQRAAKVRRHFLGKLESTC